MTVVPFSGPSGGRTSSTDTEVVLKWLNPTYGQIHVAVLTQRFPPGTEEPSFSATGRFFRVGDEAVITDAYTTGTFGTFGHKRKVTVLRRNVEGPDLVDLDIDPDTGLPYIASAFSSSYTALPMKVQIFNYESDNGSLVRLASTHVAFRNQVGPPFPSGPPAPPVPAVAGGITLAMPEDCLAFCVFAWRPPGPGPNYYGSNGGSFYTDLSGSPIPFLSSYGEMEAWLVTPGNYSTIDGQTHIRAVTFGAGGIYTITAPTYAADYYGWACWLFTLADSYQPVLTGRLGFGLSLGPRGPGFYLG